MPRTREQNEALKDGRREQILRAALGVFAARGLAATRISDIAAASELSYGLVYHYFPDKEAIYLALVERALRGAHDLVARAVEAHGPAWERLRGLYAEMLESARATPEYFQLIMQAQSPTSPPSAVRALVAAHSPAVLERLAALVRQGQEEGRVTRAAHAEELAYTLLALLQGLSFSRALDNPGGPAAARFPHVETALRLLAPDGAAGAHDSTAFPSTDTD